MLMGLFEPSKVTAAAPATFTFQTPPAVQTSVGASTATFSANIGTATSDRIVVVGIQHTGGGITISGITIAGTSANKVYNDAGAKQYLFELKETSHSGAQNIVVSGSGNFTDIGIIVGTLTGLTDSVPAGVNLVSAVYNNTGTGTNGFSADGVTIPSGGIGVFICGSSGLGGSTSVTFAGTAGGEDTHFVFGGSVEIAMAHVSASGSQSPGNTNTGWNFAGTQVSCAAWGP